MATFVEFWAVDTTGSGVLPFDVDDICGHLLADWVPSLPAAVGSSFIDWPPFLLEPTMLHGKEVLALRAETGRSERQWKGLLSWMLGVAGARHVLAYEGYRWIAPLSAFYPDAIQTVDLSAWHSSFPRSSVVATRLLGNRALFGTSEQDIARVSDRAERELSERTRRPAAQAEASSAGALSLETELGLIEIDTAEPVLTLARHLRLAETAEAAAMVLQETDSRLDTWERSRRAAESDEGKVVLPFGVELRLPREFERRR